MTHKYTLSLSILVLVTLAICWVAPGKVEASTFSYEATENIDEDGQFFDIKFSDLPESDGSGALLTFVARGDYTQPFGEKANLSFESIPGTIELTSIGVRDDTIEGLNLLNFDFLFTDPLLDVMISFEFEVEQFLLDELLLSGGFHVLIQNDEFVANQDNFQDFVQVGIQYETTKVPLPGAALLFLSALSGIRLLRGSR
ncbi:MAG: hypothetical protein AB8G18_14140 [Gammaproteobacteria bacterium]